MRVDISQLMDKENGEITVSLCINDNIIDCYPGIIGLKSPINIVANIKKDNDKLIVEGRGNAKVEMLCDRCLAPVVKEVSFTFDDCFDSNDDCFEETETIDNNILDLGYSVKSGMISALPMKVLCKEDCAGLCPICGKDLNEGSCDCDTTYINPNFESLRSLFKLDEEV